MTGEQYGVGAVGAGDREFVDKARDARAERTARFKWSSDPARYFILASRALPTFSISAGSLLVTLAANALLDARKLSVL
jgi:hypothetical protein